MDSGIVQAGDAGDAVKPITGELIAAESERRCPEHGLYAGRSVELAGKVVSVGRCPECEAAAAERAEKARTREAEQHIAQRRDWLWSKAGIPPRFQGRRFENYSAQSEEQQRVLKVAHRFAHRFDPHVLASGASLVLLGEPGAGKTHLACAIGHEVIRRHGRRVLFTPVIDLLRAVKETYAPKSPRTERQVIAGYVEPELLILDEIGVQFGTETERTIITDVINKRYNECKPTILITNLGREELAQYIGVRAMSRMEEGGGAILAFTWGSYRERVAQDPNLPKAEVDPVNWDVYLDVETVPVGKPGRD